MAAQDKSSYVPFSKTRE